MTNEPLIIERTFKAPVKKVWDAIIDKNVMRLMGFEVAEFRPEVGFEFRFSGGPKGDEYVHVCKVTEVAEGTKLAYSWRYDGHPGDSLVTYELFDEGNETRLRLTHEGLETIAVNGPAFARENFAAGWTEIIVKIVKEYVEKS